MPRRLPELPSVTPLHSLKEPSPPPRPVSPIESLNTLEEDDFRIRFLPPDRHTGWRCCNGKVNKGRDNRHRCQNFQPAEELFITLDPAPEDASEVYLSREDTRHNGLVAVPRSLPAQYLIRFNTASNIRPEDLEACFKLVEQTSSLDYKSSSVGWSAAKKRQEMADPDMKYLLLTTSDGVSFTPAYRVHGFLSFMLTREDELPVIYCYEIHLLPSLQRRGIGKKLMRLMEDIGQQAGVQGSMLTVFTKNEIAKKVYERMGYGLHESSPSPRRLRGGRTKEPDYQILWKTLEGAWIDEESDHSSEEASAKIEDSASDVEDGLTNVQNDFKKEEMSIKSEEMDFVYEGSGAMNVKNENIDVRNDRLDVNYEAMGMKAEGVINDIKDEGEKLMIKDEEMDFKKERMEVKYKAMNVKSENRDVWYGGLDVKHEAVDMKAEGGNSNIKGEEKKLMVKNEGYDIAVKHEQEDVDAKPKIKKLDVNMKIEDCGRSGG